MDRPFLHISADEGPVLVNLLQIARITSPKGKEDEITFHMSDGQPLTFHGDELVSRLTVLLQQYTIDLHGQILPMANLDYEVERELAATKEKGKGAETSNP